MAYLQPPLTIISSNDSTKLSSSTTTTSSSRLNNNSKSSIESFRLPAATWFDEDQNHFVALEERIVDRTTNSNNHYRSSFNSGLISGFESLLTNTTEGTGEEGDDEFELVRYQAFGLPQKKKRLKKNNTARVDNSITSVEEEDHTTFEDYDIRGDEEEDDDDSQEEDLRTNNLSAFESAAKKFAAKERKNKSLVTEIAVSFPLPLSLANMESSREEQSTLGNTEEDYTATTTDDDDDTTTVMVTRRIPILAKFSPVVDGVRYLALQYTPT